MGRVGRTLKNETSATVVAQRVFRATGLLDRLGGLVTMPNISEGDALVLERCNGIHTFGMRYSIAVVVLDRRGSVIKVVPNVRPWRVVWPVRGGHATVEMLPATLARSPVRLGDRLMID